MDRTEMYELLGELIGDFGFKDVVATACNIILDSECPEDGDVRYLAFQDHILASELDKVLG